MSKLEQSLCGSNEKHDQEIFDTIMDCFKGEHPKMLPEIQLLTDGEIHYGCDLSDADLCFLSQVEYVGITLLQVEVRGVINMGGIDSVGAEGPPLAPTLSTLLYITVQITGNLTNECM